MIYYTVYKIINKITGKLYIGAHQTENLDDGYMGSGKYLIRSIHKHGLENFDKDILYVFFTPEEMYAKEAEIVNEDFLAEENTYNLRKGGMGGWPHALTFEQRSEIGRKGGSTGKGNQRLQELLSDTDFKKQFSEKVKRGVAKGKKSPGFKGRKHTDDAKNKIGAANSKLIGKRNSQYGTMWITNGNIDRKILRDEEIPEGFKKGRKLN